MLLTALRKSLVTKSPSLMAGRARRSTCTQAAFIIGESWLPAHAGRAAAAASARATRIQFFMVVSFRPYWGMEMVSQTSKVVAPVPFARNETGTLATIALTL